jgi:lipopolysaccharide transport system ATP-binding protein
MPHFPIKVDHVFKKFKRGELHNSLRDLIPAVTGKFVRGQYRRSLDKLEFWALEDVCFEVDRGEAFGVIGPNGAGKSTILKLLSRIMKPSAGVIQVNGRLSALIEVSAGFHPDLTGRENIYLNGTILGLRMAEIERRFDEIVAFSGLEAFIDTPVKRFSSGMYARLGFSVAAHVDPDILLVDEVLSVGDFLFQKRCVERMGKILKGGATVVFVSHNLQAVASLCTRTLLLEKGRVLTIGASEEVVRQYLEMGRQRRTHDPAQAVVISDVRLRGRDGPRSHFQSGQKGYIDVEVVGNAPHRCERLAVILDIGTSEGVLVLNTSTERLGAEAVSLRQGETVTCTFALDLHLTPGKYHVSACVYRSDIEKTYDEWECAQAFVVTADRDIRGIANLYPEASIECIAGPCAKLSSE